MRRLAAPLLRIVVIVVVLFLPPQGSSGEAAKEVRRVLIINDIGIISSPGFAEIDQAIFTGLQKSPYQIELYDESLNLILFPDRVSQDRFREEIIQKYSARKPDVIIAAGPESLKFIAKVYDKFQGTPIIFCTIWSGIPDELRHGIPFTGVVAQLHPKETLNVALHLLPSTKHVVVVGGVGKFDEGWEAIARQSFHNYESKLEFTYLFDLTMPALLERLKHLPNDTIVYHTSISQDSAGGRFIDSAQSIPMVASAANAPVFVMDDVDLRAGTVGGDLVNWADDARIAAEIAVRVLNGEKPQDVPVVTSNHSYMFDWRALKRWGMNEKNLPPGSIVLNRQPTVWESYKNYILGGIALILLEGLLIFALLWQRKKRRKVEASLVGSNKELKRSEASLQQLSGRLIDAQEQERTRIARELHDDFSQRMALLQIGLEQIEDENMVGFSSQARQQLHNTSELASEISANLHDLSHQLHPSRLDTLGLISSLRGLCKEFSQQHKLGVQFVHKDIPERTPKDVTLCLFRIAQEGLRNVVKHSGVSAATVTLSGRGDRIDLCISDAGVGFETKSAKGAAGLGLISMRERLRLVGGDIVIESEPSHGTRLYVHVPLPTSDHSDRSFTKGAIARGRDTL